MFSTQSENCIPICQKFLTSYLFAAELEEPKIGISGKKGKLDTGANDRNHKTYNKNITFLEMDGTIFY